MLYRRVDISEPAQFVGVHPVRWHEHGEPTAAFVEAEREACDCCEHGDDCPVLYAAYDGGFRKTGDRDFSCAAFERRSVSGENE